MIYLFLVVPGLHCSARAFASCHEQGYSPLWSVGFLLRWRPLLWSTCSRCVSFRSLWALGMASVVAHGLSCLAACGNFPDQGLNPCPLHWQVDSYPLYHQGSPAFFLIISWAVISERLCKWPKVLINIVLANNNYVSSKIYYIIFTF